MAIGLTALCNALAFAFITASRGPHHVCLLFQGLETAKVTNKCRTATRECEKGKGSPSCHAFTISMDGIGVE